MGENSVLRINVGKQPFLLHSPSCLDLVSKALGVGYDWEMGGDFILFYFISHV